MDNWWYLIIIIVLCILSIEASQWSFIVFQHCRWVIRRQIVDRRKLGHHTIAFMSASSGLMAMFGWSAIIYIVLQVGVLDGSNWILPACSLFLAGMVQILTIHTWYLMSSFICIPIEFIPILSRCIIKHVNKWSNGRFLNYIPMKTWERVFTSSDRYRSLIINFLDVIPDMAWVKDTDNRYVYVNKAMLRTLLLSTEEQILGKTSEELAASLKGKGVEFTFAGICSASDIETLKTRKATMFYEYGMIGKHFKGLRVLKAPAFDHDNRLVGTIAAARDITNHIQTYNQIEDLFRAGRVEEGVHLFYAYKSGFFRMLDATDLSDFKIGSR